MNEQSQVSLTLAPIGEHELPRANGGGRSGSYFDVLREHGAITSQRLFAHFVREKLRCLDKDYAITDERVRKIAIQSGLVSLDVETRDTGIQGQDGPLPGVQLAVSQDKE